MAKVCPHLKLKSAAMADRDLRERLVNRL